MRIAVFTDTAFPNIDGVAISVERERTQLEELGHTVTVVTSGSRSKSESSCIAIHSWPRWSRGRISLPVVTRRTWSVLENLQPDVVHINSYGPIGLLGVWYARRNHVPSVATWHTDLFAYLPFYPSLWVPVRLYSVLVQSLLPHQGGTVRLRAPGSSGWLKNVLKSGARAAFVFNESVDAIVTPSPKAAEYLKSAGLGRTTAIVPTGTNSDLLVTQSSDIAAVRRALRVRHTQEVVGYVGRLAPEKNIELLLRAFGRLVGEVDSEPILLLVGDDPHRKVLEQLSRTLGISRLVRFFGAVPHENVGVFLDAMDVFVHPATTDLQCIAVCEALASGVPTVMVDEELAESYASWPLVVSAPTAPSLASSIANVLQSRTGRASKAPLFPGQPGRGLDEVFRQVVAPHGMEPTQGVAR